MSRAVSIGVGGLVMLAASCKSPPPFDYSAWLAHPPRSILVLPPINDSVETQASYGCLSTVTRPIAERGFYVFPVAVVDAMLRENGLPTPRDMHAVPLAKLREVFDPDAVLYLTVSDWGTRYQILSSTTTVLISGRLVDAKTGAVLWSGQHGIARGSGGGSLVGALASALVTQVARSVADPSRDLSRDVQTQLFTDERRGLLPGPYSAQHEARLGELRRAAAASK